MPETAVIACPDTLRVIAYCVMANFCYGIFILRDHDAVGIVENQISLEGISALVEDDAAIASTDRVIRDVKVVSTCTNARSICWVACAANDCIVNDYWLA